MSEFPQANDAFWSAGASPPAAAGLEPMAAAAPVTGAGGATTGQTPASPALAEKLQRDLGVGVIWLVVLSAIAEAPVPIHGYEIARSLSASAPEGFSVKHGTLYPILRSMESDGLVSSTLVASNEGPARKCFRITPEGRATLEAWIRSWRAMRGWVNQTLGEQS